MAKVLSTKLKVDEVDRFTTMAVQQGESKAGLLKRLVLDYMNSGGKVDREESVGRPEASTKSSTGKTWLLLMIPIALWLKSHTSIAVDGQSRFITWN